MKEPGGEEGEYIIIAKLRRYKFKLIGEVIDGKSQEELKLGTRKKFKPITTNSV